MERARGLLSLCRNGRGRDAIQRLAHLARVGGAGGCQPDRPCGAHEKPDAEVVLQVADGPADGTVRDMQLVSGLGKAEVPRSGLETWESVEWG